MRYYGMMKNIREALDECPEISEIRKLWTMGKVIRMHGLEWSKRAKSRIAFHRRIAECQENGQVALVFSGMDCDCVRYENDVRIMPADWREIDEYIDHQYSWADGPMHCYIEKPSVANALCCSSRDLALEAHENGHPHSISY